MAKKAVKKSRKFLKDLFVFILVFSWVFSGWPQILDNPPMVEQASAATIPSGVIIAWPSTNASIPTGEGWSRVTGLDTYYLEGTTSDPSASPGGATTHDDHITSDHQHTIDHTHTINQFAAVAAGTLTGAGTGSSRNNHNHASAASGSPSVANNDVASASIGTASNNPPYLDVIWLQSDGNPTGIPAGAIVWYGSDSLPTGWTRQGGNSFLRGAAGGGDGGGTGGTSDAHSHTDSGHTHTEASHTHSSTSANSASAAVSAAGATVQVEPHNHPVTSTSVGSTETSGVGVLANGDGQPPFYKLNSIRNDNAGADLPTSIIAAWTGTIANIPTDWVLCDGVDTCPSLNNYFIKGANADSEIGTTGGAATHTHGAGAAHSHTINNHVHTFSTGQSTSGSIGDSTGTNRTANNVNHVHADVVNATSGGTTGTQTITAGANTDNRPPYKEAAFIMYKPALISITIDGTDGDVNYGILASEQQKSSIDTGETQVFKNNGGGNELFEIQTSDATDGAVWIAAGTTGTDRFIHEYSSSSGGSWFTFTASNSYYHFASNVASNATRSLDLRITAPTSSTSFATKNITVTIRASSM